MGRGFDFRGTEWFYVDYIDVEEMNFEIGLLMKN